MKSFKFISFFLFILFLFPIQLQSQNEISREKMEIVAREIISNASSCALITVDDENIPRARAMDAFPPEKDFTVWFGTKMNSRKLHQIKENNNVSLYYIHTDLSGYVLIHGKAEIINSKQEKDKRWKDSWKDFYNKKRSDYILIKVTPVWLELISTTHNILGDEKNWEVPRIYFNQ